MVKKKKKKVPRSYMRNAGNQIAVYVQEELDPKEIPEVNGEAKIKYIMVDCPHEDNLVSVTTDKIHSWNWDEDGNIVSLFVQCICGNSHVLSVE